jgi:hypothetical protein
MQIVQEASWDTYRDIEACCKQTDKYVALRSSLHVADVVSCVHGTIQDTYTPGEYELIMRTIMTQGTPESDRSLAMGTWAHSSVGCSDDVRLFYLSDLIAPQYIPAVGERLTVSCIFTAALAS